MRALPTAIAATGRSGRPVRTGQMDRRLGLPELSSGSVTAGTDYLRQPARQLLRQAMPLLFPVFRKTYRSLPLPTAGLRVVRLSFFRSGPRRRAFSGDLTAFFNGSCLYLFVFQHCSVLTAYCRRIYFLPVKYIGSIVFVRSALFFFYICTQLS